jgi:hypothetical protein
MASDRITARIAFVTGAIGLTSAASLAAFFALGGPLGAINDWTIGLFGFMSGVLAVSQRRPDGNDRAMVGVLQIGLAVAGSVVVVIGSWMVISDVTGFLLAGLVESVGFALIGAWLIELNRSRRVTLSWPRGLRRLGAVTGFVMALGFIVVPGIAIGIDDASAAPPWIWIGFLGWLGIFFLYPIWCIALGARIWKGAGRATIREP